MCGIFAPGGYPVKGDQVVVVTVQRSTPPLAGAATDATVAGPTVGRTAGRSGRRGSGQESRAAIESAARRQFGELGFDRTSLRQVGFEAGVDPTLVSHFYGSKERLFAVVIVLPFDPAVVIPQLATGPRGELGLRLAHFVVRGLETPGWRELMTGMIRAASTEPSAAALVRERLTGELLTPLADAIGSGKAEYRAGLVMSQIVGLTLARYIVAVEPLASAPSEQVIADVAPTLQRYLSGPLDTPQS